jgi:hypothetical protein
VMLRAEGRNSTLARTIGRDAKGKLSLALYMVAIPAAFLADWVADVLYVTVAFIWLIPDRRIERVLHE